MIVMFLSTKMNWKDLKKFYDGVLWEFFFFFYHLEKNALRILKDLNSLMSLTMKYNSVVSVWHSWISDCLHNPKNYWST